MSGLAHAHAAHQFTSFDAWMDYHYGNSAKAKVDKVTSQAMF